MLMGDNADVYCTEAELKLGSSSSDELCMKQYGPWSQRQKVSLGIGFPRALALRYYRSDLVQRPPLTNESLRNGRAAELETQY